MERVDADADDVEEKEDCGPERLLEGQADVILGADVIYDINVLELLFATANQLLARLLRPSSFFRALVLPGFLFSFPPFVCSFCFVQSQNQFASLPS